MSNDRNHDRNNKRQRYPNPENSMPEMITADEEQMAEQMEENSYTGEVNKTPSCLLFNSSGLQPVEAVFRIPVKNLKEYFLKICKSQIDDVIGIKSGWNPNTGDTFWFCVFAENSHHFDDGSMSHTAIGDRKSDYLSKEVKAFAQKFGMDPNTDLLHDDRGKLLLPDFAKVKKIVNSDNKKMIDRKFMFINELDSAGNRSNKWMMRLSWTALAKAMFDIKGDGFKAKYGKEPPKCAVSVGFKYSKGPNKGEYGAPTAMEVRKYLQNNNDERLMPKGSFNYREF